ncbi:MAG: FtsX-like permease family protein, partial [Gemmatimonadaceae bacterium]
IGFAGLDTVHLEPAVLAWTMSISILSAALFGFGPALFASTGRSGELLKAGTRVANASSGARWARGAMIVVEVALSVALLVVAGLLLRTYDSLHRVPLGFDPRNLNGVRVSVPKSLPAAGRPTVFADILAVIRAIPGIHGATIGGMPLEMPMLMGDLEPEGGRPAGVSPILIAGLHMVQPNFFDIAGVTLRGTSFTGDAAARMPGASAEIIVSEALARRLWPRGNAIGSRMRLNPSQAWTTVVGVAGNLAVPGRRGDNYDFQVYQPVRTTFTTSMIVFRASKPLDTLMPSIRHAVAATFQGAAIVGNVDTSDGELRDILAGPRFAMALLGAFAVVALVLCAVGLYGVISYAVGQRTHEIGVRVALGAQPRDVVRLVARESGILVGAGLIIGLGVAVVASRAVRSFLFGVGPVDATTYALVSVLLAVVALAACAAPARRAMRVDPIVALAAD